VKQVGSLSLVATKAGFITSTKKINVTSGFLNSKDQFGSYSVTVPMYRDHDPSVNKALIVLTFNGSLSNLKLRATSIQG
jgi:hypothetical protein